MESSRGSSLDSDAHESDDNVTANDQVRHSIRDGLRGFHKTPRAVGRDLESTEDEATQVTSTAPLEPPEVGTSAWFESRLHPVLPVSDELDVADVIQARSRFYRRVQELVVSVNKSNRQATLRFRDNEIVEITNFFFSDMIGQKALKRLSSLVKSYAVEKKDIPDDRSAARATRAADDPTTPLVFQRFFRSYSRAAARIDDGDSLLRHVRQVSWDLAFLKEYNALKKQAEEKDPDLVALLDGCGIQTTQGRSLVTCLIKYVTNILQMSKSELSNFVQAIQAIDALVRQFSIGVIVLLPPGHGKR